MDSLIDTDMDLTDKGDLGSDSELEFENNQDIDWKTPSILTRWNQSSLNICSKYHLNYGRR